MNRMYIITALLILACPAWALSAQNYSFEGVNVYRIHPDAASIGQKAWITFVFENTGSAGKTIILEERLGNADFNKTSATAVNTTYGTRWVYHWTIMLNGSENTSVSYWIAPKAPGPYVLSPPELTINGNTYRMKSAVISVSCNRDGVCGALETYLNCPQDCKTSQNDGTCDGTMDSICDPDCAADADPDCALPTNATPGAAKPPPSATVPVQDNMQTIIVGSLIGIAILAIIFWLIKKK
jgi:hypothetical protein